MLSLRIQISLFLRPQHYLPPPPPPPPDGSGVIGGASDSVLVNKSAEPLDHRVQEPADNNPLKSTTAIKEEKDSDEANNNPSKSTTAVEEEKDSDEDFTTPPPSTQSRSNVKDVLCAKPHLLEGSPLLLSPLMSV